MEPPRPAAERPTWPRALRLAACFALVGGAGSVLVVTAAPLLSPHQMRFWSLAAGITTTLVAGLLGAWVGRRAPAAPLKWLRFVVSTVGAGALTGALLGGGTMLFTMEDAGRGLLAALLFGTYGMIFGAILAALCFVPPLAVVFAAHTRVGRARPGSFVDLSDRRRVWFGTAAVVFLAAWITTNLGSAANDGSKAIALAATSALLGLWVADVAQVTRLFQLLTGLGRSDEDGIGSYAPFVDLGIGDERWVQTQPREGPYRSTVQVTKVVRGALFEAQRILTRATLVHAVVLLVVVVGFVRVATRTAPHPVAKAPSPRPPPPVLATPISSQTSPQLSWYPQHGPILVDLDADGTEDVVGLRWDSSHEDAALSIVATDGATFRSLWKTTPLRSQWASPRTRLVHSSGTLFLTDSEGFLHIYDLKDGKERVDRVTLSAETAASDLCGAPDGEPQLWLRDHNDWKRMDRGILVDGAGRITKGNRPKWCRQVNGRRYCGEPGEGACHNYQGVKSKTPRVSTSHSFEENDVAVTLGTLTGGTTGSYLVGHDPKTRKIRWEHALASADDELHGQPQLQQQLANGRLYSFYQLKTGKWVLGATDGRTGEAVWSREPPRTLHGANFVSMTISPQRLYLVLNWRVEVFNPATGESLGVIW